jgi:Zn-dependent peptidase ImmA (M78 family)
MKTNPKIEVQAKQLLYESKALRVPVPIEKVAYHLDLRVEAAALGDDISGVLIVESGKGTIGFNSLHPVVRQRFTVAHEIGHFILHQATAQLFIDKQYTAVYRRDQNSSSGEHLREIQANQFAAALLMPDEFILREFHSVHFDLGDDRALMCLADKFQVSVHAISLRLDNLEIFTDHEVE